MFAALTHMANIVRCQLHNRPGHCYCAGRMPLPTDEQYREAYRNYTFDYDYAKKPPPTEVPEGWADFKILRVGQ